MKKHETSVFLIVGAVLVIAIALVYFSGGKLGAATAAVENVKCVFRNSVDTQKCYLAGGPVIVISPPNKVCYGVKDCTLKVKSQPGGVAKWKSSCGDEILKTVVDGKNDVVVFTCPAIKFYAKPSSVYYDHSFTVYWDATHLGADRCGGDTSSIAVAGKPVEVGSSWTDQDLGPEGSLDLIARHVTYGFAMDNDNTWMLGIQCWKEDVLVASRQIEIMFWVPGLNIEFDKEEYALGDSVKVDISAANAGVIVDYLKVYVIKVETGVSVVPSDSTFVASFEGLTSTTLGVPSTFMPTAGTYIVMACLNTECSQMVNAGFKVV